VINMLATRILLAYDGTDQARRALDYVIELSSLVKAEIGVVSVVPVHAGRIGVDPWDDSKVHSEELIEARDRIKAAGITPSLYEPFGEIAEEIVNTARGGGYDHIVIGSRHVGLVERLLQGSVSNAVSLLTPVTVTIVHCPAIVYARVRRPAAARPAAASRPECPHPPTHSGQRPTRVRCDRSSWNPRWRSIAATNPATSALSSSHCRPHVAQWRCP